MDSLSKEEKEAIYEIEDIRFDERTNRKIEIILNLIEKLQKENQELKENSVSKKEIKKILRRTQDYDLSYKDTVVFNILIGETLGETRWFDLEKMKDKTMEVLRKENQELKEENKKINKVADKMYEYISYYGWEDFESNTGCNREEMVDYFYKE